MDSKEINKLIQENKGKNLQTKEISDGYHTFEELYTHRIYLFAVLCNTYADISWKSKKHYDEENEPMYNDSFIAGINTPLGEATYHVKLKYWNLFKVKELERAPKYDGYTPNDVLKRLLSIK